MRLSPFFKTRKRRISSPLFNSLSIVATTATTTSTTTARAVTATCRFSRRIYVSTTAKATAITCPIQRNRICRSTAIVVRISIMATTTIIDNTEITAGITTNALGVIIAGLRTTATKKQIPKRNAATATRVRITRRINSRTGITHSISINLLVYLR